MQNVQMTLKEIEKEQIIEEIKVLLERLEIIDRGEDMKKLKFIVGDNVRRYRKEIEMSQKELSEKIGKSGNNYISTVENGGIDLKMSDVEKIAEVLEIKVIDLVEDWS